MFFYELKVYHTALRNTVSQANTKSISLFWSSRVVHWGKFTSSKIPLLNRSPKSSFKLVPWLSSLLSPRFSKGWPSATQQSNDKFQENFGANPENWPQSGNTCQILDCCSHRSVVFLLLFVVITITQHIWGLLFVRCWCCSLTGSLEIVPLEAHVGQPAPRPWGDSRGFSRRSRRRGSLTTSPVFLFWLTGAAPVSRLPNRRA